MMNVYLFQPNFDFGTSSQKEYYLPYSAGLLWAYVSQFSDVQDNFELKGIRFNRDPIDVALNSLDNPDICAFSSYVWSWEYNKALASAIKSKFPNCLIVFGGPSVTDKPFQKLFFNQHRYVDCIVNGEGEYSFYNILQDRLNNKPIKKVYAQSRINELDTVPSPYLTGIFDKIVSDNPDTRWMGILETNRGCPFACTFCDWGSVTYSKIKKFDIERVLAEVRWLAKNKVEFLAITDANFGIFPDRDQTIAEELARVKQEHGYPKTISVGWNKNAQLKNLEIAKIMGSRGLTLSMQSLDDNVLTAIKRTNMEINNLAFMLKSCENADIPAYTELILGLPLETKESWKENHYKLLEAGNHAIVEAHLTMLLENSEMNTIEHIEQYGIESVLVEHYLSGNVQKLDKSGVVEKMPLVRSTQTMAFDDLVDSFMFSWVLINLHYLGYCQIFSRYLNNVHGVSYRDFYEKLISYIQGSTGVINAEYNATKENISHYMTHGKFPKDSKFDSGHTIMYVSMREFIRSGDEVLATIYDFVKLNYAEFINSDLVKLQNNFILNTSIEYPVSINIHANVFNGVFNTEYSDNINIIVEPKIDIEKNIDIVDLLWRSRRRGTTKAKLSVEKYGNS